MFQQPFRCDQAPVADDAHCKAQLVARLHHHSKRLVVQEGLATCKVDLLHPRLFQKFDPFQRALHRQMRGVLGCVKAEPGCGVTEWTGE